MKHAYSVYLIIALLFFSVLTQGQEIVKETYTYAVDKEVELKLDRYFTDTVTAKTPCVLFMFGGGFVNGERDRASYLNYFHTLAANGIQVVSIDYIKGLKGLATSKEKIGTKDFIRLFNNTIHTATENLIDATHFVLQHADAWNVDVDKVIVSGSSAGAISVLHGEYALANQTQVAQKLPENFRYAGVISFAGAIFSTQGKLKWKSQPAPMLLFHGNADKNVPYGKIKLGPIGFYGSKFIVKQLDEMEVPYYFYDEAFEDHLLADSPMQKNLDLILNFIQTNIIDKKGIRMHMDIKVNGRKPVKTKFSIKEYMGANAF